MRIGRDLQVIQISRARVKLYDERASSNLILSLEPPLYAVPRRIFHARSVSPSLAAAAAASLLSAFSFAARASIAYANRAFLSAYGRLRNDGFRALAWLFITCFFFGSRSREAFMYAGFFGDLSGVEIFWGVCNSFFCMYTLCCALVRASAMAVQLDSRVEHWKDVCFCVRICKTFAINVGELNIVELRGVRWKKCLWLGSHRIAFLFTIGTSLFSGM